MSTTALEQLYPSMSAEELASKQSSNEPILEYIEMVGTPFHYVYVTQQEKYYLLLGKTNLEPKGFKDLSELTIWVEQNMWTLVMRVASTVTYDMVKPYVQLQAAKEQGFKINNPE